MAVVCSCSTDFKPKPKGFNHIDLPDHKYQVFKEDSKPYSFEMSVNAFADDDTAHYKEQKLSLIHI